MRIRWSTHVIIAIGLVAFALSGISRAAISESTYAYDNLGRIVRVEYPGQFAEDYAYDAAGNRTVVAIQHSPVLAPVGNRSTDELVALEFVIAVTDADGDTIAFNAENLPAGSTLDPVTGAFSWTPGYEQAGSYQVTFHATDLAVPPLTDSETITITVANVNRAPLAVADTYNATEDVSLVVGLPGVLGNDSDPDGTALTAVKVSDPAHGSVTLNANGSFTYQPELNYAGLDGFTYKASDGQLESDVAAVEISVSPANDAPTDITITGASVDENRPVGTVIGTFGAADPDTGDTVTYSLVSGAGSGGNGFFAIAGSSLVTANIFNFDVQSTYSIRVRATDQGGLWFEKAVTITVIDGNCTFTVDPPGILLPASGGAGEISVSTQPGCAWAATKSVAWIAITSGGSGIGSGTLQFSALASSMSAARTGSIAVGGSTASVAQSGQPLMASFIGIVDGVAFDNPFGSAILDVTFDASSSWGVEAITNFHWDFGDGTNADTAIPVVAHSYSATGSFNAVLTITGPAPIPRSGWSLWRMLFIVSRPRRNFRTPWPTRNPTVSTT
jgi:YD repeat-containing protein/VCBS repeat-containing protein